MHYVSIRRGRFLPQLPQVEYTPAEHRTRIFVSTEKGWAARLWRVFGVRCLVFGVKVPVATLYGPRVQHSDESARLCNAEGWTLRWEFFNRLTYGKFS
jgi:hypothetical protein